MSDGAFMSTYKFAQFHYFLWYLDWTSVEGEREKTEILEFYLFYYVDLIHLRLGLFK